MLGVSRAAKGCASTCPRCAARGRAARRWPHYVRATPATSHTSAAPRRFGSGIQAALADKATISRATEIFVYASDSDCLSALCCETTVDSRRLRPYLLVYLFWCWSLTCTLSAGVVLNLVAGVEPTPAIRIPRSLGTDAFSFYTVQLETAVR